MRYEIGIAARSSHIVWIHGPFAAGHWNDLKIFRKTLKKVLAKHHEKAICDGIYRGEERRAEAKYDPNLTKAQRKFNKQALARHETLNQRIKKFNTMNTVWRHSHEKHRIAFTAIISLLEVDLAFSPLFDVVE